MPRCESPARSPAARCPSPAACLALAALLASPAAAAASTRYDPALRFRTIVTPHFVIHFHQGVEEPAQRLAAIAEEIHADMAPRLGARLRGRTHLVLVDQTDLANGWATPLPYNAIEVTAVGPESHSPIGHTDDWLRLVFAHEYAHILHLDRSRRLPGAVRRIFGRTPFAFPNLFLPRWQIEGIATYEESRATAAGRLHAGDFLRILTVAARHGRVEPLDRVNGGLIDWPGGHAPYLYGAVFHDYLAGRFGEASLAALADETAGRLPYFGARAFRRVFGRSLGELWREFRDARGPEAEAAGGGGSGGTLVSRVTRHGFLVTAPRWDPWQPGRLLYSVRNPHGFPALMAVDADGGPPVVLATRFLGEAIAVGETAVYFDQLELVRNVALYGDLYALPRRGAAAGRDEGAGGGWRRVRRLTRAARLAAPDLSPDGRSLACVLVGPDRRALALVDLRPGDPAAPPAPARPLVSEPGVFFSAPRWSPDGRLIAVERRLLQGPSEIVVVNAGTGAVRVVASAPPARHITPAWTPDGRTILFASDRAGPFDLYATDATGGATVRLTALPGGAEWPDVSPDGRTVAFAGYTPDGHDLFTMPLELPAPSASAALHSPIPTHTYNPQSALPNPQWTASPYSPWQTLLPRFWLPVADYSEDGVKAGVATAGVDVLGRHAFSAAALWAARHDRLDWSASYTYARWRPRPFVAASDEVFAWDGGRRERTLDAGVVVPVRRVRHSQSWFGALSSQRRTLTCPPGAAACPDGLSLATDRHALRFGWALDTSRLYGYSISREDGALAGVTTEHVRAALGSAGDADAVTAQIRGYLPFRPRHAVLAVRAAGGAARGDPLVRRTFAAGGSAPASGPLAFGCDALALVRGFRAGEISGRRLAVANVEYRLPVARVERGRGTWPVFLRTVHAAAFADAGHAWDEDEGFRAAGLKTAVGVEGSLDLVLGYYLPVTAAAGAAWTHDRATGRRRGPVFYARVGRAF